jgi:hypothetical protein
MEGKELQDRAGGQASSSSKQQQTGNLAKTRSKFRAALCVRSLVCGGKQVLRVSSNWCCSVPLPLPLPLVLLLVLLFCCAAGPRVFGVWGSGIGEWARAR